jgi:hypothetical protein
MKNKRFWRSLVLYGACAQTITIVLKVLTSRLARRRPQRHEVTIRTTDGMELATWVLGA